MTIEQKIESAKNILTTASRLIGFCFEHKEFIHSTQVSLFAKILAREDLTEQEKENELDIATAGILIVALSFHQSRYKHVQQVEDHLSPYLWDENGYLVSPYFPMKSYEVLKLSGMDLPLEEDDAREYRPPAGILVKKGHVQFLIPINTKL